MLAHPPITRRIVHHSFKNVRLNSTDSTSARKITSWGGISIPDRETTIRTNDIQRQTDLRMRARPSLASALATRQAVTEADPVLASPQSSERAQTAQFSRGNAQPQYSGPRQTARASEQQPPPFRSRGPSRQSEVGRSSRTLSEPTPRTAGSFSETEKVVPETATPKDAAKPQTQTSSKSYSSGTGSFNGVVWTPQTGVKRQGRNEGQQQSSRGRMDNDRLQQGRSRRDNDNFQMRGRPDGISSRPRQGSFASAPGRRVSKRRTSSASGWQSTSNTRLSKTTAETPDENDPYSGGPNEPRLTTPDVDIRDHLDKVLGIHEQKTGLPAQVTSKRRTVNTNLVLEKYGGDYSNLVQDFSTPHAAAVRRVADVIMSRRPEVLSGSRLRFETIVEAGVRASRPQV
ncbi:hypothetical protein D9758_002211 [Tetrapyrgos nigripes]|uniref:Uncharacterized protein n=1 Tax=Tetrapyrgos nigripes TaxID=182062 RepID=A0A8H5GNX6_9AGAR|nr:hypothetical protein D9758_002211 [Tetrapyrgos nigripes]